eukprot:1161923-Pelagomonas_calceolata.AAC.2
MARLVEGMGSIDSLGRSQPFSEGLCGDSSCIFSDLTPINYSPLWHHWNKGADACTRAAALEDTPVII